MAPQVSLNDRFARTTGLTFIRWTALLYSTAGSVARAAEVIATNDCQPGPEVTQILVSTMQLLT